MPTKRQRGRFAEVRGTGRAVENEKKCPHIVELAISKIGLDVGLARRIMDFHKSRHIEPRHGRIIHGASRIYYRWCFSDLQTARAFIEQFGRALCEPSR